MSHSHAQQPFPRAVLIGAAILVASTIVLAGVARTTGIGTTRLVTASDVVASRDLRFADRDDGSIAVTDAHSGQAIAIVASGNDGFVRGAMRGLVRERKRRDIGAGPPFRLAQWSDGRLTLEDPATARVIDLSAFGAVNAEAFARFMPKGAAK